jgi:hypothetical protein
VVKLFEFPPTADGVKCTTVPSHRMAVDEDGASIILESGNDPNSSIVTIAESGQIRMLPLATAKGTRYHDWFFAKGVAAEVYQFAGDKPPAPVKIDTFDLVSGRKIATKTLLPAGFRKGFDRFVLGTLPAWSAAPNAVISVNSAIERGICGYR